MARQIPDRRRRPTRLWDVFATPGRRSRIRRASERSGRCPPFVDRHAAPMRIPVYLVLILTLIDGVLTLHIIEHPGDEANPIMAHALERGITWFFLSKYVLTAVGMGVLLILREYRLGKTRLRVGDLIPLVLVLYTLLVAFQLAHLRRSALPTALVGATRGSLRPTPTPTPEQDLFRLSTRRSEQCAKLGSAHPLVWVPPGRPGARESVRIPFSGPRLALRRSVS